MHILFPKGSPLTSSGSLSISPDSALARTMSAAPCWLNVDAFSLLSFRSTLVVEQPPCFSANSLRKIYSKPYMVVVPGSFSWLFMFNVQCLL